MKPPHVVISADQLTEDCVAEIGRATEGWATWQRIPQDTPRDELDKILSRTQIAVGWVPPSALLASPVETYLCGSAGYDAYQGIGLDRKPGFQMTSAGAIMGATIAEHCLALQFALVRELPALFFQQARHLYQRRWRAGEIAGSTACIVGLGNTGHELARRCRALGQRVIGVCRSPDRYRDVADELYPSQDLAAAVRDADHVFCVLPGGPETRRKFHAGIFAAMKPDAYYYSASRGSVTCEADLIAALRSGHLGGAALDVFAVEPLPADSPLWDLPNVIVSPHSAGLSRHLNARLTRGFVENLSRLRTGRPLCDKIPGDLLAS